MKKRAFFLDRDGVINESHHVDHPDDFVMFEGVGKSIKTLNDQGFEVFVVTNQAGVSLGYITQEQLDAVHERMLSLISAEGGVIREVKACTHRPREDCECRKPNPGMLLHCIRKYDIDPEQSYMVGDRDVDIIAGEKAGVKTVLISQTPIEHVKPDFMFPTLYDAVQRLVSSEN